MVKWNSFVKKNEMVFKIYVINAPKLPSMIRLIILTAKI